MNRKELFKLHTDTCKQAYDLMHAKNRDYAHQDGSPFHNLRACKTVGVNPLSGVLVRCVDKFSRITTFIENGKLLVSDESVDDSIVDVINYMVILRGMIIEDKENNKVVTNEKNNCSNDDNYDDNGLCVS